MDVNERVPPSKKNRSNGSDDRSRPTFFSSFLFFFSSPLFIFLSLIDTIKSISIGTCKRTKRDTSLRMYGNTVPLFSTSSYETRQELSSDWSRLHGTIGYIRTDRPTTKDIRARRTICESYNNILFSHDYRKE